MSILPKIEKCPRCRAINLLRINGIVYENVFKSFADWTLKKILNCRKCKIELGLFSHNNIEKKEKLVWIDLLKCEESYYDYLCQLQIDKVKCKKQNVKYYETQKEINDIQNKIRLNQIKVKIKAKIEERGMLI
jgi:hypothetical protein